MLPRAIFAFLFLLVAVGCNQDAQETNNLVISEEILKTYSVKDNFGEVEKSFLIEKEKKLYNTKSQATEIYVFNGSEVLTSKTIIEYNHFDSISKVYWYDGDGSQNGNRFFEYDSIGNLRWFRTIDREGKQLKKVAYDYTKNGSRKKRIETYNRPLESNKVVETTYYCYHHNGNLIETRWSDNEGRYKNISYAYQTSEGDSILSGYTENVGVAGQGNRRTTEYVIKFDKDNNRIESQISGRFGYRKYDRDGRLLVDSGGFYQTWEYDVIGNLIEWNEVVTDENVMQYAGDRSKSFEYQYDQHGNWVIKKSFENGIIKDITERTISYRKKN